MILVADLGQSEASANVTLARPAAIVGVGMGAFLGILRFANADAGERSSEWLGDVALAVAYALPSVLALVALRSRPVLLLGAGVLACALSFSAFSGVSLALLVPGAMFFAAYRPTIRNCDRSRWRRALAIPITLLLGLAAFFVLFAHEDPFCSNAGCTSDTINSIETAASFALAIACVGVGAWLAGPRPLPLSAPDAGDA